MTILNAAKHEPVNLSRDTFEAMRDVIRAAKDIGDSFTDPAGEFISDDLTRSEWSPLRDALDRLEATDG